MALLGSVVWLRCFAPSLLKRKRGDSTKVCTPLALFLGLAPVPWNMLSSQVCRLALLLRMYVVRQEVVVQARKPKPLSPPPASFSNVSSSDWIPSLTSRLMDIKVLGMQGS